MTYQSYCGWGVPPSRPQPTWGRVEVSGGWGGGGGGGGAWGGGYAPYSSQWTTYGHSGALGYSQWSKPPGYAPYTGQQDPYGPRGAAGHTQWSSPQGAAGPHGGGVGGWQGSAWQGTGWQGGAVSGGQQKVMTQQSIGSR